MWSMQVESLRRQLQEREAEDRASEQARAARQEQLHSACSESAAQRRLHEQAALHQQVTVRAVLYTNI